MNCPHCQQPMIHVHCEDCDARGYWWRPDGFDGWRAIPCGHCAETGHRWHCTNTARTRHAPASSGIVWYPLSSADSAVLRMVIASVEREEKR